MWMDISDIVNKYEEDIRNNTLSDEALKDVLEFVVHLMDIEIVEEKRLFEKLMTDIVEFIVDTNKQTVEKINAIKESAGLLEHQKENNNYFWKKITDEDLDKIYIHVRGLAISDYCKYSDSADKLFSPVRPDYLSKDHLSDYGYVFDLIKEHSYSLEAMYDTNKI